MRTDGPGRTAPSLRGQLGLECEAMLRYAIASGMTVPAPVLEVVEDAITTHNGTVDGEHAEGAPERTASTAAGGPGDARREVVRLSWAHDELARLVAPATPRAILILSEGTKSRLSFLGPVRLVRHMLIVVIVLLAGFVVLAMSPDVNTRSGDIFRSSGTALLINELFFLAAGGLGAAFAGLFIAYRYIAAGTYDPKYESTYWVRLILGLMAGVILPALIPLGGGPEGSSLTKPLLALLGGFSASVLYEVLDRLVQNVESLVRAGSRDVRASEREAAAAREVERAGQERLGLISDLLRLQEHAKAGSDRQRLADDLDRVVRGVMPAAADAPAALGAERATAAADGGGADIPAISAERAAQPELETGAGPPNGDQGRAAAASSRGQAQDTR